MVGRTLFAHFDCGVEEHGFARVRCDVCRWEFRVTLSRCAWRAVRDLHRVGLLDRHAVRGMVVSIQTSWDLANWQPHLRAQVSAGVFKRQGQFTPSRCRCGCGATMRVVPFILDPTVLRQFLAHRPRAAAWVSGTAPIDIRC